MHLCILIFYSSAFSKRQLEYSLYFLKGMQKTFNNIKKGIFKNYLCMFKKENIFSLYSMALISNVITPRYENYALHKYSNKTSLFLFINVEHVC